MESNTAQMQSQGKIYKEIVYKATPANAASGQRIIEEIKRQYAFWLGSTAAADLLLHIAACQSIHQCDHFCVQVGARRFEEQQGI